MGFSHRDGNVFYGHQLYRYSVAVLITRTMISNGKIQKFKFLCTHARMHAYLIILAPRSSLYSCCIPFVWNSSCRHPLNYIIYDKRKENKKCTGVLALRWDGTRENGLFGLPSRPCYDTLGPTQHESGDSRHCKKKGSNHPSCSDRGRKGGRKASVWRSTMAAEHGVALYFTCTSLSNERRVASWKVLWRWCLTIERVTRTNRS